MPLNHAPFKLEGRRVLLLAEGEFSTFGAKTAVCYLRYRPDDVIVVLDRSHAGQSVNDVLDFGGDVPIVSSVRDALQYHPEVVVVGVAPAGGQLIPELHADLMRCAEAGLDIVSGLHSFLRDDAELAGACESAGGRLWDVRWVPEQRTIGVGSGCTTGARTVLVVGSDCNVGKMTATVELHREAKRRGLRSGWAATGQTGMMLLGRGIAIDRVVADFIGGAAEDLVNYEGKNCDLLFVEGQGSLLHPGFAAVTLGLLYGVMPDCMVLAHAATRGTIGDTDIAMPPLARWVELYESMLAPFKQSSVVALAINTADIAERDAYGIIERIHAETGLPACDPVREHPSLIVDAVLEGLR